LPCRFEITSKNISGQPEYIATMTNWRINPQLPDNEFTFTPPPGSARIDFLEASQQGQDLRKEPK
jgi:hypothetical protein